MAEPLVFLPGMMCDARLFTSQINDLSSELAVMVAPITIGERVEEIASNVLGNAPAKFALAGAAMGGAVALEVFRRAPDRVSRIALISTSAFAETPQTAAEREPQMIAARSGRLAEVMRQDLRPEALAPNADRLDVLAQMYEMAESLGGEVYVRQSRALQRRRDQQAVLRKINVPCRVICGEHDSVIPVKRQEFMAELIPSASLSIIRDAGHVPTLEQPAATTAALRDWMQLPFVLR